MPGLTSGTLDHYRLLAESVSGLAVGVSPTADERGYTDGRVVFVPELDRRMTAAAVAVQAAMLGSGSFESSAMTKIAGRRRVRARYVLLEAVRATCAPHATLPRWVAREVAAIYDGPVPASLEETLKWTFQPRRELPEPPAWIGTIKPLRVLRTRPAGAADAAPGDVVDPSKIKRVRALRELDDEEEFDGSKILDLLASPFSNPLSSKLQNMLGGRAPGRKKGGGNSVQGAEMSVDRDGRLANSAVHRAAGYLADERVVAVKLVPTDKLYAEWNTYKGRYRDDWCAVTEFDPPAPDEDADQTPTNDPRLRQKLARLGLKAERHRRQHEGDTIGVEAVVELRVDLAAGGAVDPRVYESKLRTARDLGVLVLLDATGSTGESTEGRRVFDEQRAVAGRLTAALEELGDRVATYGFRSSGREIQFLRVKGFEDRFDRGSRRRLSALAPSGYTRLGAAIRHGTWMLTELAGTSINLLVVVGDGLPYDNGYEGHYAHDDVRRALREAVLSGVGCACVTTRGTTDDEILERAWGTVPYCRIDQAADLADHAHAMFTAAIKESVASRRAIERRPAA